MSAFFSRLCEYMCECHARSVWQSATCCACRLAQSGCLWLYGRWGLTALHFHCAPGGRNPSDVPSGPWPFPVSLRAMLKPHFAPAKWSLLAAYPRHYVESTHCGLWCVEMREQCVLSLIGCCADFSLLELPSRNFGFVYCFNILATNKCWAK